MMKDWHVVGQKVCKNNPYSWSGRYNKFRTLLPFLFRPLEFPQQGQVYTISQVVCQNDTVFLALAEFEQNRVFTARSFRPVRPTSIECFRSLLSPTPQQVRDLEDA